MRLKGFRIFAGGLALAAVVGLTGVAGASAQTTQEPAQGQEGKGRRGGRFGGPFGGVELTDAQREQMSQIAERYRASFRAQREQGRGGRRDRVDPLAGGVFDESAVRAAAQARANEQVEREVAHARMMHEMYSVLTPEQKAQLQARRQQREQRRQERGNRRALRQGQTQLQ